MKIKIKICGLTSPKEAQFLNKNHVDFAGMVLFFPKSRRNISLEQAEQIMEMLDRKIRSVAVVVSPTREQLVQIQKAGFDYVQIHGELSEALLKEIHIPVWKAFNVNDLEQVKLYHNQKNIAGYVFDGADYGSGKTFDWNLLKDIPRDGKLFLLAGGLNPSNVADAIRYVQPDGVDVSSGVEKDFGKGQDGEKIEQFVEQVRAEETYRR